MSQLEPKQLNQRQPYLLLLGHFPTFIPEIKEEEEWMSPPRQEHTSKYIESVIYEPLPANCLKQIHL